MRTDEPGAIGGGKRGFLFLVGGLFCRDGRKYMNFAYLSHLKQIA